MGARSQAIGRVALAGIAVSAAACSLISDYRLGGESASVVADDGGSGPDGTTSSDAASSPESSVTLDATFDAPKVVCTEQPCAVQLAAAAMTTCARFDDGAVRCWGNNDTGVVGASTGGDFATPVKVGFAGPVDSIALGAWGRGNVTACAHRAGTIECWGEDGNDLRLGRGGDVSNGGFNPKPAAVAELASADEAAVSCNRTCARIGGTISCWGKNYADPRADEISPTPVETPRPVTHLSMGREHLCAILDNQEVACAGYLVDSHVAWNDTSYAWVRTMEVVAGVTNVVQLAELSAHVCALRANGEVFCWGRDDSGELGRGTPGTWSMVPALVALPGMAKAVGVGTSHSCAVLSDDSVWCWGRNDAGNVNSGGTARAMAGQVGAPDDDGGADFSTATPRKIAGLPSGVVTAVVGGYAHSCALLQSGAVYCWGSNKHGQLGRGKEASGSIDDLPHPVAQKVLF